MFGNYEGASGKVVDNFGDDDGTGNTEGGNAAGSGIVSELRLLEMQFKLKEADTKNEEVDSKNFRLRIHFAQMNPRGEPADSFNVSNSTRPLHFDPALAVTLIPAFSEESVDGFFATFEKTATVLNWLVDLLSIMLQQAFKGRALHVFASLPDSDARDYSVVKE